MRFSRICLLSIALIAFSFIGVSCSLLYQGSTLYRVLRALKFRVSSIESEQPTRLDRVDVLFLWRLREALDGEEIEKIRNFVEGGGTLIVAGYHQALDSLFLDYGVEMRPASKPLETSKRLTNFPIFPIRPVSEIHSRTTYSIRPIKRDVAPLYGRGEDYSVVTFRVGNGRAIFLSCPHIFSYFGLKDGGNATFVYNLLTTLPRRARIALAEYRYYPFRPTQSADPPIHLLFKTPVGLGVVYIGLIVFLFLVLRGKRFGKPLVVEETHRRFGSEYVFAMTALYQKGNTQLAVLKQIRDAFRTDLAARWDINPKLETASFVDEIAKRKPIDTDELRELLKSLEPHEDISEAHLLSLAKQVETYRDKEKIGRTRLMQR